MIVAESFLPVVMSNTEQWILCDVEPDYLCTVYIKRRCKMLKYLRSIILHKIILSVSLFEVSAVRVRKWQYVGQWMWSAVRIVFRPVLKFDMRLLCSSCLSLCSHRWTRLPLEGFSWYLIFFYFSKSVFKLTSRNMVEPERPQTSI